MSCRLMHLVVCVSGGEVYIYLPISWLSSLRYSSFLSILYWVVYLIDLKKFFIYSEKDSFIYYTCCKYHLTSLIYLFTHLMVFFDKQRLLLLICWQNSNIFLDGYYILGFWFFGVLFLLLLLLFALTTERYHPKLLLLLF